MDNPAFVREGVKHAWQHFSNLTILAHSSLLNSSLCQALLWEGDCGINAAYSVQAALMWSADQLAKSPSLSKQENAAILRKRFIEGATISQVASELQLAESNIKNRQRTAWKQSAKLLEQENTDRHGHTERVYWICATRYHNLSAEAQHTARFLSLFTQPELRQLLTNSKSHLVDTQLVTLLNANVVVQSGNRFAIHPQFSDYVKTHVTSIQHATWHEFIGHLYQQQRQYLLAVHHWIQAQKWQLAAELLIVYKTQIGEYEERQVRASLTTWHAILAQFKTTPHAALTARQWAQLDILTGTIAKYNQQPLQVALNAYQRALRSADDLATQAEALFESGHALQTYNVRKAIAYLEHAIALGQEDPQRAVQFWVFKARLLIAWLFITHYQDMAQGYALLQEIPLTMTADKQWLTLRADYHNTWSEFYKYQQKSIERTKNDCDIYAELCSKRIMASEKAVLDASLANNPLQIIKMTYQLGVSYLECGKPYQDEAIKAFVQAKTWAQESNNICYLGHIENALGSLHYQKEQYATAQTHYLAAFERAQQIGDRLTQAAACGNIAENALKLGRIKDASHYLAKGEQISAQIGNTSIPQWLTNIKQTHRELTAGLNQRQQLAIQQARKHTSITNAAYRKLTGCAQKTAARDLDHLVTLKIFEREGQGRGTAYRLTTTPVGGV